jgi:hypothetical protein
MRDRGCLDRRRGVRLAPWLKRAVPAVVAVTVGVLAVRAAAPASADAADLFPVDDWLGSGLKKAGDVVLGPLQFGVKEIARLLVTLVGALADLLVPKSLVRAGVDGIRWLVQLPPLGQSARSGVRMPHLAELRGVLTWIGITLLPLGLVVAGGRAVLAPSVDGESPSEVFGRVIVAGVALIVYDWAWGAATRLSHLLTDGLLGLPWVTDGVEKMLQTLVIGGAAGSAVASEFVVPLLILVAGTALLALLLVRVGLEVACALLYVLGGLVLGLSATGFGWRLLYGWLVAVTAIFVLPLLWAVVFCTGAALMLDAGSVSGRGGFVAFVAQLYNVAAALAVFWVAIKLAQGVFRHAGGAIASLASARGATATGRGASGGGMGGAGHARALAENATPAGLARFSQNLRGGLRAGAAGGMRAGSYPLRHPVGAAQTASYPIRRPVQATREAAAALRHAVGDAAAYGDTARARVGRRVDAERHGGRFSSRSADERRTRRQDSERSSGTASDAAARSAPVPRPSGSASGPAASTAGTAAATTRGPHALQPGGNGPPGASRRTPDASAPRAPTPPADSGSAGPPTAPSTGLPASPAGPWWAAVGRKRRSDRNQRKGGR